MRNTLADLNNHLFAALERLNDEEMTGEKLKEEMNRSRAVSDVAKRIIENGSLVLEARKVAENSLEMEKPMPKMLEG